MEIIKIDMPLEKPGIGRTVDEPLVDAERELYRQFAPGLLELIEQGLVRRVSDYTGQHFVVFKDTLKEKSF